MFWIALLVRQSRIRLSHQIRHSFHISSLLLPSLSDVLGILDREPICWAGVFVASQDLDKLSPVA